MTGANIRSMNPLAIVSHLDLSKLFSCPVVYWVQSFSLSPNVHYTYKVFYFDRVPTVHNVYSIPFRPTSTTSLDGCSSGQLSSVTSNESVEITAVNSSAQSDGGLQSTVVQQETRKVTETQG